MVSRTDVRDAILAALGERGVTVSEVEWEEDLISLGVDSATTLQILSALEDTFDVVLPIGELFARPLTLARVEAELSRLVAT